MTALNYVIERACPDQIAQLIAIERAGIAMFRDHRAWSYYLAATIPPEVLREAIDRGLVWVAIHSERRQPLGFVWLDAEAGQDFITVAEIDVLPAYGRRGIGTALLEHACDWARAAGYRRIDLGTLADVPWNAPFYAAHGFSEVDKYDPRFAYARERDHDNGFPEALRVFMSRPLTPLSRDEWTVWPAPAKLNLFLRILERRPDGYHDLQTVFRLLDWGDELYLRTREDGQILRSSELPGVAPDDDLTVRAARLLQQHVGTALGAEIRVEKRIPAGGGLGGGSSDAATVLVALNHQWACGLDDDALAVLGRQVGADVPVFVRGHSAWAEGIGERIAPIRLPRRFYLILNPGEQVSTSLLFQAPELTRQSARATISSFVSGDSDENAFEAVVRTRYPRVAAALDWLGHHGRARLSGTGGCVFLETETRERAEALAGQCPDGFAAYVADGVNVSPLRQALKRHRGGAAAVPK